MQKLREKIKMFSFNQMNIYHSVLEAFNIIRNSSSEKIKMKWTNQNSNTYFLRSETSGDQKIPEKPMLKCMGFSYNGSKLFINLPRSLKEATNPNTYKSLLNS